MTMLTECHSSQVIAINQIILTDYGKTDNRILHLILVPTDKLAIHIPYFYYRTPHHCLSLQAATKSTIIN